MEFLRQYVLCDESLAPTHNGMPPTPGKFLVPDYWVDADARADFFDKMAACKQPFCIMENIKDLDSDAKTRYRIDFDVSLSTADPAEFDPFIPKLKDSLYDVLSEYCGIQETTIILMQKGGPTECFDKDGMSTKRFKHGAKLICPEFTCTHAEMRQLRSSAGALSSMGQPSLA